MAVSHDGSVIVGFGINPSGNREAWIARIRDKPLSDAPTTRDRRSLGPNDRLAIKDSTKRRANTQKVSAMHAILNRPSRELQIVAALFSLVAFAARARADIFQWEYINPADPSQGKQQSTMLVPTAPASMQCPAPT